MSIIKPASVSDLTDYIKSQLGYPVINIEMSDDQYEIIIEEALEKFFDFAFDAYEEKYISYTIPEIGYVTLSTNIINVIRVYGEINVFEYKLSGAILDINNVIGNKQYDFEFSKITNKLRLVKTLLSDIDVLLHVYEKLDETENTKIYNHNWLKRYAVALAKKQWGMNISKYGSVILPGGMTLNADIILNEGKSEIEVALEELKKKYSRPPLPLSI